MPDLVADEPSLPWHAEQLPSPRAMISGMNTAVFVAVLAGSVTALGWLANYLLSARADRRGREAEALLRHTERQLEELYGPLAFLVIEGRQTFRDLLASLGRNYVFRPGGTLPDNELKTWLFWVDNDLLPRNEQIKRILMDKTHLIDRDEMPASYVAFLDHHNSWKINHLRWQKEQVPYSFRSSVNWPKEFEDDVIDTFGRLKARHATILGNTLGRATARGN
jgi:hypothetical protein